MSFCDVCSMKKSAILKLDCNHKVGSSCLQQKTLCPKCSCSFFGSSKPADKPISSTSQASTSRASLVPAKSNMISFRSSSSGNSSVKLADSGDEDEDGFAWFYSGKTGWWKYDKRMNRELENAYQSNKRGSFNCTIHQHDYKIDFALMQQIRRDNSSLRRKIKRDSSDALSKGIAGMRV